MSPAKAYTYVENSNLCKKSPNDTVFQRHWEIRQVMSPSNQKHLGQNILYDAPNVARVPSIFNVLP